MYRLYPLLPAERDWFKNPKVDSFVTAVTKKAVIPVEGDTALKDPQNRQLDALLRQAFDVNVLSLIGLHLWGIRSVNMYALVGYKICWSWWESSVTPVELPKLGVCLRISSRRVL